MGRREKEPAREAPPPPSLYRNLLFSALAFVLFFALVEGALAVFGVRPVLDVRDPYVGFEPSLALYRPAGDGMLETAPQKLAFFNRQRFRRDKPPRVYRIFTLGGSTTYGRPLDDATSFSGWLRAYLDALGTERLGGERRYEVVNAGGISYASYRVATLMRELAGYDPDLFIIYSGNNEFLERRTYGELLHEPEVLSRTRLVLQRSRLWALGQGVLDRRRRAAEDRYRMTGEVEEILERSAGLDEYERDETFARQVLEHYRWNLQRMVNLARGAGAEVILVTIPVNEKDFAPFKSQHRDGLDETGRAEVRRLLTAARAALEAGRAADARAATAAAVELDPRYAESWFLHGRALLAGGETEPAAAAFERAIVEDVCPLRALPEVDRAIRDTAARGGVELVDYRALLEAEMVARSGHAILGDELFFDHVHPTVEANGLLGRALVERLDAIGAVDAGALERVAPEVAAEIAARVDEAALARAYKNLSKVLIWAGKEAEAAKYVRLAEGALGDDWEVRYNAGTVAWEAGDLDTARASFEEAVRIEPRAARAHDRLASVYAAMGDLERAVSAGERAVELDPDASGAWNNLGTLYRQAGDGERALAALREAIRLEPGFAEAHNNLGSLHFDRGELERARERYERALALRPRFADARFNLALLEAQAGRIPEAVAAFEAALALDDALAEHPGAAGLHHLRGRLFARDEDFAAAARAFERAVALDPALLQAWIDLGMLDMVQERYRDAARVFGRALEAHGESAVLHHSLAKTLLAEHRVDEALAHLEKAVAMEPRNAFAKNDLAVLYEHLGRLDRALELYRQAARLDPSFTLARENAERLGKRLGR